MLDGADDTEDVIRRRQEVYAEQTEPLIGVYRDRGLLVEVLLLGLAGPGLLGLGLRLAAPRLEARVDRLTDALARPDADCLTRLGAAFPGSVVDRLAVVMYGAGARGRPGEDERQVRAADGALVGTSGAGRRPAVPHLRHRVHVIGVHLRGQPELVAPRVKVLFTTGYARNAALHAGRLDPGVDLLGKPFTSEELVARVRGALDR